MKQEDILYITESINYILSQTKTNVKKGKYQAMEIAGFMDRKGREELLKIKELILKQ